MIQTGWRWAFVGMVGAALLTLSACGAARSTPSVKEEWLARVPEEQLGEVHDARAARRQAADEVIRAEVAMRDAERSLEVARKRAEAARLHNQAEEAALEGARAKGQPEEIQQAQAELRAAEEALEAARAEVAWREQRLQRMEARKRYQERQVELADAELSLARYQALAQSGDVRAQQLSEGSFRSAVADAQRRLADAQQQLESQIREEQQARARWERLSDQVEGYGGGGQDSR